MRGIPLFVLIPLVNLVAQAYTRTLRGGRGRQHEHGRQNFQTSNLPAVLMPRGVSSCPGGQEIRSQSDCDAAFKTIIAKYEYEYDRTESLPVTWPHFPKGCSVSKGNAYFNTDETPFTHGDSAVMEVLISQVVCAPAAYREFSTGQFCKGTLLYNGGGPEAEGKFKSLAACREECDQDTRCQFFLWKHEPGTSWVNHCATFTNCDTPEAYTDGESARVFQKIIVPSPPATHSFQIRRSAATAGKPGINKAGSWFACQLANPPRGTHERIVWTENHMVIMTRSKRDEKCGDGVNKLGCSYTSFYTGRWSIKGTNVMMTWEEGLPAMTLTSEDGGQNFYEQKTKRYACSNPPSMIKKLVKKVQPISAAGAWFACQRISGTPGSHQRIVWTPGKMVIMASTRREKHCGKSNKLSCSATKFYTGKWSIDGANVLMKWDKLPPLRLSSPDGGKNFYTLHIFGKKTHRYVCSMPPAPLKKLIAAGIEEAQQKLAAKQRSNAGLPTDWRWHGCQKVSPTMQEKVKVLVRGMTLEQCFVYCRKTPGMHYFGVTRGDSCFCSALPPGKVVDPIGCDLTCTGDSQQYCGGYNWLASTYTMIDCLPPDAQEKKQEANARKKRIHGLYSVLNSQSCGQAKGNEIEINDRKVLIGFPEDCEAACVNGMGAVKCHGFTYNALYSKCTFHEDAFWGDAAKDPNFSCYFKKAAPIDG